MAIKISSTQEKLGGIDLFDDGYHQTAECKFSLGVAQFRERRIRQNGHCFSFVSLKIECLSSFCFNI